MIIASHKALGLATLVKFLTLYRSSHWLSTQGLSLFQAFEASEAMSLPLINFTESHLYCYLQIGSIEWNWLTRKGSRNFPKCSNEKMVIFVNTPQRFPHCQGFSNLLSCLLMSLNHSDDHLFPVTLGSRNRSSGSHDIYH